MTATALEQAIEQAGSQSAFARAIGASQQIVSYWLARQKPLPAEFVLRAEAAFGVSRHELRPDIYPAPVHAGSDTTAKVEAQPDIRSEDIGAAA